MFTWEYLGFYTLFFLIEDIVMVWASHTVVHRVKPDTVLMP